MIHTERLILVPIDMKYSNDLFHIWNDFEVIKYTYMTKIQTLSECTERIELLKNRTNPHFINNFIVTLEDKAIGVIGFPIQKTDPFECRLYYYYGRKYWGKGYATEAAKHLQAYIFTQYPHAIITADAVSINQASIQVLKNIRLHQTHIEESGFQNNGYNLDLVHFRSRKLH